MAASSSEPYKAPNKLACVKSAMASGLLSVLSPNRHQNPRQRRANKKSFPKICKFRQTNATGIVKNKPAMRRRDSFSQKFGAKN